MDPIQLVRKRDSSHISREFEKLTLDKMKKVILHQDEFGETAFSTAIKTGQFDIAHKLWTAGVGLQFELLKLVNNNQQTVLHYLFEVATHQDEHDVVSWIINDIGDDELMKVLLLQDFKDQSCFHLATISCNATVIKKVLDISELDGSDIDQLLQLKDFDEKTFLHYACEGGNSDVLEVIQRSKYYDSIMQLMTFTDIYGNTPLHVIRKNYCIPFWRSLKKLLMTQNDARNILEMKNPKGLTVPEYAADDNNIPYFSIICDILCKSPASGPDIQHLLALDKVIQSGNNDMIKTALKAARVKGCLKERLLQTDSKGNGILLQALKTGNPAVVETILQEAFMVEISVLESILSNKNDDGQTIFHLMCKMKSVDMTSLEGIIVYTKKIKRSEDCLPFLVEQLMVKEKSGHSFLFYHETTREEVIIHLVKEIIEYDCSILPKKLEVSLKSYKVQPNEYIMDNKDKERQEMNHSQVGHELQGPEVIAMRRLSSNATQLNEDSINELCTSDSFNDTLKINEGNIPKSSCLSSLFEDKISRDSHKKKTSVMQLISQNNTKLLTSIFSLLHEKLPKQRGRKLKDATKFTVPSEYHQFFHNPVTGLPRLEILYQIKHKEIMDHPYTISYLQSLWTPVKKIFYLVTVLLELILLISITVFVMDHTYKLQKVDKNDTNSLSNETLFPESKIRRKPVYLLMGIILICKMFLGGLRLFVGKLCYEDLMEILYILTYFGYMVVYVLSDYSLYIHTTGVFLVFSSWFYFASSMPVIPILGSPGKLRLRSEGKIKKVMTQTIMIQHALDLVITFSATLSIFYLSFALAFQNVMQFPGNVAFTKNFGLTIMRVMTMASGGVDFDTIFMTESSDVFPIELNITISFLYTCFLIVMTLGVSNLIIAFVCAEIDEIKKKGNVTIFRGIVQQINIVTILMDWLTCKRFRKRKN